MRSDRSAPAGGTGKRAEPGALREKLDTGFSQAAMLH
jgi:hypothetical protein